MRFWITQHAKERYIQRVLNNQHTADNITIEIIKKVVSGKDVTNKVYDECPRYILFLYEKYNELGLTIVRSENIIFITRKRKGTYDLYDVITCYVDDGNHLSQFKNSALSREQIFLKIKEIKRKLK